MAKGLRRPLLMLALAAALAWTQPGSAADERVIEQLDIVQPRTFGYHIGDKFTRTVSLQLRAPYTLDRNALPGAGRLSEWLSLEAPQVSVDERDGASHYEIQFVYQVVNVGTQAASIAVPHHELVYGNGQETLKALIPATRLTLAPLIGSTEQGTQAPQAPLPLVFDASRAWLCAAALAASALLLAWFYVDLPWRRKARPFSRARRTLRAAERRGWQEQDYEAALRAVHEAFNETAGRTVFADSLATFFAEHVAFNAIEAPVSEFYARSREYFFSGAGAAPTARYSARELLTLVQGCCDLERGLR